MGYSYVLLIYQDLYITIYVIKVQSLSSNNVGLFRKVISIISFWQNQIVSQIIVFDLEIDILNICGSNESNTNKLSPVYI